MIQHDFFILSLDEAVIVFLSSFCYVFCVFAHRYGEKRQKWSAFGFSFLDFLREWTGNMAGACCTPAVFKGHLVSGWQPNKWQCEATSELFHRFVTAEGNVLGDPVSSLSQALSFTVLMTCAVLEVSRLLHWMDSLSLCKLKCSAAEYKSATRFLLLTGIWRWLILYLMTSALARARPVHTQMWVEAVL